MWQERVQRYILPGSIEQDPEFRVEVQRLSCIGLQVIGGIEVCASAFMVTSYILLNPSREMLPLRIGTLFVLIGLGLLTLLIARWKACQRHARRISVATSLLAACILTGSMLLMTQYDPSADTSIPGNLTLIMLAAAIAIPFRPTDMLVFGFLVETSYVGIALAFAKFYNIGRGVDPIYVLYIFMLTCLATALSAVVYEQRRSNYEWHRRTLETADKLREAEARNLLTENAASVGRLAAALSHELNSPIGALVSGVDTLLLLASKQSHSGPSEQQRLLVLQNELRKSIQLSTNRLREIVERMQRFSNLDAAEVQAADVNQLIQDVAALLEPHYEGKVELEMNLSPLPPLVCRPQQLSAVFSNLIGNAIDAANGNGRVSISSRAAESNVEISFADNGRGLAAQELENIFDPGFKVKNGRISSGNWSMFSSRQIIRDHGGEIHMESERGKGTKVRVVLPMGQGLPVSSIQQ